MHSYATYPNTNVAKICRANVAKMLTIVPENSAEKNSGNKRFWVNWFPSWYSRGRREDEIASGVQLAMLEIQRITENVVTAGGRGWQKWRCGDCYYRGVARGPRLSRCHDSWNERGTHGRPREINSFERFHPRPPVERAAPVPERYRVAPVRNQKSRGQREFSCRANCRHRSQRRI